LLALSLTAAAASTVAAGCAHEPSCLEDGARCEEIDICEGVLFSCGSGDGAAAVEIGTVAELGVDLDGAEGAGADVVMRNALVTVVIDQLGEPRDLAPSGGTIIDFGPRGGADNVVQIYQLTGILPDDAFEYTRCDTRAAAGRVSVTCRGHLDDRPRVDVATVYELRACEPGVRVRTELLNRSPDAHAWFVGDAAHWGDRNVAPFAPVAGQGFDTPELELGELQDSWGAYPYVLARGVNGDGAQYGFVPCDRRELEGVNDTQVSALGTPRQLVRDGERVVLERFIATRRGAGLAAIVATVLPLRAQLHGDPPAVAITGRVTVGGAGFGGDQRRAMVVVSDGDRPIAEAVPGADGSFALIAPPGADLRYEVRSFGRVAASGSAGAVTDLGDIEVPAPGTSTISVVDDTGTPIYATVHLHPVDDGTAVGAAGSFYDRFGECTPWLGPPGGPSPACNRVLVTPQGVTIELPAGSYLAYATAGPDWTMAETEIGLPEGGSDNVELALARLDVAPPGWLSADLHVHGRASFDSSIPDLDRVLSFAAAGINVVAATDHDQVATYEAAIVAVMIGDRVAVMPGVELTPLIPWLDVQGEDIPRVVGHFNFWPMPYDASLPRGGAPWDEKLEPGELFDIVGPLIGEDGVRMLNHPMSDTIFGRHQGYLKAIALDPRAPIPPTDDGTNQGMLARSPRGGARNVDFDVVEVYNGASGGELVIHRLAWHALLDNGYVRTGASNSDSHSLSDAEIGMSRSLVHTGGTLADFDAAAFNRALKAGDVVAGSGIVVLVTVGSPVGERRGLGFDPFIPEPGDTVDIEVRAPPWIPVTEVRAVTSRGAVVIASGDDLVQPPDPYGTAGVVRWTGRLRVTDLVSPSVDDWLIIEAGIPLLDIADLDDDGVPDTTDNNGDGIIDDADVEEDEDTGPIAVPAPADAGDPRWTMSRVMTDPWPIGWTNPILVDWAGNGWGAPGVGGAR
jgi:hypothetical protein